MTDTFEITKLQHTIERCMKRDIFPLKRRLATLRELVAQNKPFDQSLQKLSADIQRSLQQKQWREVNVPALNYPQELPVSQKKDEILDALITHQVVIVAGETGSGKTTQLPKICLEAGRGISGLIGHTQPRRIAARTVAARIAEELNTQLGDKVGYQVRFNDQSGDNTYVKLMTDGILLAEIQRDRYLNRYDTLIIDEAHERSLNIDFLLGYIKQILPKRPDLKIVITSATIDVARFSNHFDDAPVIEVSGRTYPVDIHYRPPMDTDEDIYQGIVGAVQELLALPKQGDILVFLSGEREIRESANLLRRAQQQGHLRDIDILPLYARLSLKDQSRIFSAHRGTRIILSTNVAETSITVPGIRYVIDTGLARISRYSYRTKVQRLPIEPISQASANQRAGRCGRVSDGVCIRLYSEEDFHHRPQYTDPEILRTNLAAVILQMLLLRIGDVRDFPFVDPPDSRLINDGFQLLTELGAVTPKGALTNSGKVLSKLPVDPRLGRMLLAASHEGALKEVLIITAALSIQDPRERPAEKRQAADEKHRAWQDKNSDFIGLLNLWNHFEEQRQALSSNQFSKYCHSQFVSYLRMREWRDLIHQIHLACRDAGLKENTTPAGSDNIHRAMLTGLLSHIGFRHEDREFLGARNRKFHIFPGSALSKNPPKWVMAAELIETSRLFAHSAATINPDWLPQLAVHLVKKQHSEPYYDVRRGQVMAYERQTLFGLTILDRKRVAFSHLDPELARKLFIRGALVEGGYRGKGRFFRHNQSLIEELEDVEDRLRQRDIVVDDESIFNFYCERIPDDINNLTAFETWRKNQEAKEPKWLFLNRDALVASLNLDNTLAQFPREITWQGITYKLSYRFEPGHASDGVSVHIPVPQLHQAPSYRFEWLVPGLLRDKCIALVKSLPKQQRKQFVPVPEYVDKALTAMQPDNRPLTQSLAEQLKRHTAVVIESQHWNSDALDPFFRANFILEDEKGKPIAQSRDLDSLKARYRESVQDAIQTATAGIEEQTGLTRWNFGKLNSSEILKKGKLDIKAFPALVDEGESVALKLLDNANEAQQLSLAGVVKLFMLSHPEPAKFLRKQLLKGKALQLLAAGLGQWEPLVEDIIRSAYKTACIGDGPLPRSEQAFSACLDKGRSNIVSIAQEQARIIEGLLEPLAEVNKFITRYQGQYQDSLTDIRQQVDWLLRKDFLFSTDHQWLQHYPRYLKALAMRLEKLPGQVQKDREFAREIAENHKQLSSLLRDKRVIPDQVVSDIETCRFMMEEYRVSTFAQVLKTSMPVSAKRIQKQLEAIKKLLP